MAFFIGVVHRKQVLIAREEGFISFSHGRESAVRNVAVGDKVVYYAPREEPDGPPVQAFVAHASVTGEEIETRRFGSHGTGYVRRAIFDEVIEVPIRPMISDLAVLSGRKNWGGVFRTGKVEIGPDDYFRIAGALLGGSS